MKGQRGACHALFAPKTMRGPQRVQKSRGPDGWACEVTHRSSLSSARAVFE